jgi:beta-glucosidase
LQLTEIDKKNKSVALSFNITNTGGYEGAEVAQVYVRDIASKEARPLKELKGFQKVKLAPGEEKAVTLFLRPGETKHVSVTLDRDAFQYFSEKKSDWVFESGEFEIWVGASSKDIRLKTKVKM